VVQDYWSNFAKTGNPNGTNLPEWREFESRGQVAMEFWKNGTVALLKRSRPTYCDVDAAGLKARLTSTKQ
jgi:para-nitrobenzyl esterase